MRSLLLLIPFFAAVILTLQNETPSSRVPGLEVALQKQGNPMHGGFRLIPSDGEVKVEFNDLKELWSSLPAASGYSSAHQDGLVQSLDNQLDGGTVKTVPRSLLKGLNHLTFSVPESACRYLMSKPMSFACKLDDGNKALAMTLVRGVPVALMSVSSGLIHASLLRDTGSISESEIYLIKVKIAVGSSRVYDFNLYAPADKVSKFYPTQEPPEKYLAHHKSEK